MGVERGGEPRSLEGPEAKYWAVSPGRQFPQETFNRGHLRRSASSVVEARISPLVNGDWVLPGPGTSVNYNLPPPHTSPYRDRRPGLDRSFLQDSLLKGFKEKLGWSVICGGWRGECYV